ncbi:N-acetylmuramoyl-L-alanine amidase [Falsirhodobacter sp. 20TX0035]|uniref:N-acetylmuramoyl-L-alanine amidase n=1 Tax=Falsirhodobacter sp. 20TX0035 TaxID=3022019 RepID=UPI00232E70AF|nr:N-acetylmuramoyl-L-alanine amidase [Falsirhodobacter sp. 20TX0035]MDB6455068.1 N-acetylmuramoyl-L-alanine amidase [Falsirhodobacter sp. 20TX0035]
MSLSPNHGPRRDGARPELIVLHYTAMATCEAARQRLCDPVAEVSAHWLISESGETIALVDEDCRAWHAGAGVWQGHDDVNSRSIGIELANDGASPFPDPQMRALEDLLRGIMDRWQIGPQGVIAHSDMAPDRKTDPGPRFDWRRLARQGLSVWPAPAAPGDFEAAAQAFGYAPSPALLGAFRLRFRPWATGPLDDTDRALAAGLDAGARAT